MRIYECPTHGDDFQETGCEDCTRILKVIEHNKEVSARTPRTSKLQESVYWPDDGGHGRTVRNLSHGPIHFNTKREYRQYLKTHHVSEAG